MTPSLAIPDPTHNPACPVPAVPSSAMPRVSRFLGSSLFESAPFAGFGRHFDRRVGGVEA